MSVDFYLGRDELLLVRSCSLPPVEMGPRSSNIVLELENRPERPADERELIPTEILN